ncbi:hypothetical protein V5O48_001929 [Marasmius crinis-equi]|uniref:SCP domain-containing protein n=1 Tax=Marasmius crinis-equi TaxID=585013 RepID=A0ABR3FX88_9AGAR
MFLTSLLLLALVAVSTAMSSSSNLRHRLHAKKASITQISTFLATHNLERAFHGAQPLTWSSSLASKAEEWAKNCEFRHTDGVLSDTPYGENIVATTGDYSVDGALQSFLGTRSGYSSQNPTYNQWTQVVWKGTKELGCAVSSCNNIFDSKDGPASMTVCLYSPVGNVVGELQDNVQA